MVQTSQDRLAVKICSQQQKSLESVQRQFKKLKQNQSQLTDKLVILAKKIEILNNEKLKICQEEISENSKELQQMKGLIRDWEEEYKESEKHVLRLVHYSLCQY